MIARHNPYSQDRIARALPFDPTWCGTDWDRLLADLAARHYRGQIVGPHGSGKTTLIESLVPRLTAAGLTCHRWLITDEHPGPTPDRWAALDHIAASDCLIIDGAERLTWLAWRRLRRAVPRLGGFIVTTHRPLRHLPRWIDTRSHPGMLAAFLDRLDPGHPLTAADIARLHQDCRGNLREALWRCYDRTAHRSER